MWLVKVKQYGQHAQQVAEQDEEEQREHEREVFPALGADCSTHIDMMKS